MRNEHELLNSRTKRYFLTQYRNKELNSQDLELGDTTPLNDTRFMEFMRKLWHEQLDSNIN